MHRLGVEREAQLRLGFVAVDEYALGDVRVLTDVERNLIGGDGGVQRVEVMEARRGCEERCEWLGHAVSS